MTSGTLTLYRIDEVVRRLEHSLLDMESGLSMVPPRWTHAAVPGAPADSWTVSMNLAHLAIYEEAAALPLLRSFEPGFDIASARRGAMRAGSSIMPSPSPSNLWLPSSTAFGRRAGTRSSSCGASGRIG